MSETFSGLPLDKIVQDSSTKPPITSRHAADCFVPWVRLWEYCWMAAIVVFIVARQPCITSVWLAALVTPDLFSNDNGRGDSNLCRNHVHEYSSRLHCFNISFASFLEHKINMALGILVQGSFEIRMEICLFCFLEQNVCHFWENWSYLVN